MLLVLINLERFVFPLSEPKFPLFLTQLESSRKASFVECMNQPT